MRPPPACLSHRASMAPSVQALPTQFAPNRVAQRPRSSRCAWSHRVGRVAGSRWRLGRRVPQRRACSPEPARLPAAGMSGVRPCRRVRPWQKISLTRPARLRCDRRQSAPAECARPLPATWHEPAPGAASALRQQKWQAASGADTSSSSHVATACMRRGGCWCGQAPP